MQNDFPMLNTEGLDQRLLDIGNQAHDVEPDDVKARNEWRAREFWRELVHCMDGISEEDIEAASPAELLEASETIQFLASQARTNLTPRRRVPMRLGM